MSTAEASPISGASEALAIAALIDIAIGSGRATGVMNMDGMADPISGALEAITIAAPIGVAIGRGAVMITMSTAQTAGMVLPDGPAEMAGTVAMAATVATEEPAF